MQHNDLDWQPKVKLRDSLKTMIAYFDALLRR